MLVLLAASTSALLSIVCIALLAAAALVAVVGTRIVRRKQRQQCRQERHLQQARMWRPSRKAEPPKRKTDCRNGLLQERLTADKDGAETAK